MKSKGNMSPANKAEGNIGDIMTTGLMLLAMAYLMIAFMNCIGIVRTREDISQTIRRFMLVAETKGYLDPNDMAELSQCLTDLGVSNIDLSGTTTRRAGFGNIIQIRVRGMLKVKYEINEARASTAKY